ncbi:MAG TPA: preprotein translocase subunit YajC [Thiolapillus brandeum]|uniref:Sec translocon accessory complex subunit YajC n=1 Tax=Thiolapillus brandeum TaxID=1076588 RepID=A0A7C5J0T8_9GAMM|nr:preprotein translocase subunit YajC [Thiolapillus brandeum]
MNFFINDALADAAAPAAAAAQQGPGGLAGLIFPIGLILILYFFMIRPQVKRQKEHKALVESLKKGDEVQTMGGLMGRITEVGENFVKVEVADGVEVTVRRGAVEAVMPKGTLKEL